MDISNARARYMLMVLVTIIFGLLSRWINNVPLAVGDALYGVMIFFILRSIFINQSTWKVALMGLAVCYLIELSQLYHSPSIDTFRATVVGHLILGQGFLWSDIGAYTIGIGSVSVLLYIISGR